VIIWYVTISDVLALSEQMPNTTIQSVHMQKWPRHALFPYTCRWQVLHKFSKRWPLSCGNKNIKIENTRPLKISVHQEWISGKDLNHI